MFKYFILFTARILLISSLNLFSPKAPILVCSPVMVIFFICSKDKLQIKIALMLQSFALCTDGTTCNNYTVVTVFTWKYSAFSPPILCVKVHTNITM